MIRVLGARVLVKRLPVPEQTESGLYLLGREYPLVGEVLAVGSGSRNKRGNREPISDLEAGDLVQFRRQTYMDTRQIQPDTFIIEYEDCLCGMKQEADGYRIWPLGRHVMIKRQA